jgi:selenocysteine lyase/cysteine desulfurase
VAQILADDDVMVRAGWLCAEPFLRYKGWGPVVRASFTETNDRFDIKALVKAVKKVRKKMGLKDV